MSSNAQTDWSQLPGRLVVISGASGSGKSTLVQHVLPRRELRLQRSVSATTRKPRPDEQPGRDYFFVTAEEFERMRSDLLEHARVHDYFYGTPAEPVRAAMARGICVLLVIDVQGGFQVRQKVPGALLIFIQAPSLDVLETRLRKRATDDDATINRRLANARRELEMAEAYDIHVINDELDRAVEELVSILKHNGCGEGKNHD
jgi:guanylate kinase